MYLNPLPNVKQTSELFFTETVNCKTLQHNQWIITLPLEVAPVLNVASEPFRNRSNTKTIELRTLRYTEHFMPNRLVPSLLAAQCGAAQRRNKDV